MSKTSDQILDEITKNIAVGFAPAMGLGFLKRLTDFLIQYDDIDFAVVTDIDEKLHFSFVTMSPELSIEPNRLYTRKVITE